MFGFVLNPAVGSITRQLCAHLRNMIETGELWQGMRLPPTRKVSQELRVARNVVIEVYEQLTAEGYLESRVGSGTYIAEGIHIRTGANQPAAMLQHNPSNRAKERQDIIDFNSGTPDLRLFPRKLWGKYVREVTEYSPDEVFNYGDPQGEPELRAAIARYMFRVKGIRCSPDQLFIVSGSSEGFLLIASACSPMFLTVYVEDPTVDFIPDIFRRMGYTIRPVGVDRQGMEVDSIAPAEPRGLLLVTPSHQYPTGSIMSIQRRQQAVILAEAAGHYIVEDDYDSEFRHKGVPVPPLQALAPSRVIYAATFSKTLSPGLRLGFLAVPPQLVDTFVRVKTELNLSSPAIIQLALARIIENGHFDRHIHKMKTVYKNRLFHLKAEMKRYFGKDADICGDETGLHVQVVFPSEPYGCLNWAEAESFGVRLSSFEDYAIAKGRHRNNIVFGYGKLNEEEIAEGVRRLHRFVASRLPV
ncbi:MocR-like pyridoxine biosynthesis transcription factor PdxR [Paenibacillus alkalitolerans]|uniref:MocR-like pyridoxine biosynthesis transcription factor PdxR n=1 Tax=Paenibacillus alkalitolerans TaxID=2799335 RepID=UPI0018F62123|nr:PLP-dependent aminotransferase family protein [Paenibacillus alkalitolerans]